MEKTMMLNVRVSPSVKQQAEDVLKQLGIPMATAIDMYLRQIMLRIAIGHFGMVTTPHWQEQIKLARHKNVMIESGGITWLFNRDRKRVV